MKSFLEGRKNIGQSHNSHSHATPFAPMAAPVMHQLNNVSTNETSDHAPTVECIKEGGKVVRLVVTCSCGKKTEIECHYAV